MEVALIRHGFPNRVEGVTVRAVAGSGLRRALQAAAHTAEKLGLNVGVDHEGGWRHHKEERDEFSR